VEIPRDVKSLLKEYEKLYARTERRIEDSLRRITDTLHCKTVDRVPVIQTTQTFLYPRHEIFYSREKNLISQLANINRTLIHETDYVPFLDPFEGVTVLAEAFGCKVEVPLYGDPWIREPLIHQNHDDVWFLKKPESSNHIYTRTLETLRFFEENTGFAIPVGATDPQGPLDVASLIWNNSYFLQSCLLHKKEVHHLLNIITDAFIEFYTMQYECLRNPAYPVHSFQLVNSNDGISISDDEAVLLSPELFEEFGVPYLSRIADSFGGLYYHCCGDFGHILDKILCIEGLRAINGHLSPNELKPEYIVKIIDKGVGLFIGMSDIEIGWEDPDWKHDNITELYDNYYIPAVIEKTKGRGVVLVGYGGYSGYLDIPEYGDSDRLMVDSSGHAIHKGSLLNFSIEEKNANFRHINQIVEKQINQSLDQRTINPN
jgi:uroporphyrinogen-III decarboxylase